jgi:RNase P subunit RPR2
MKIMRECKKCYQVKPEKEFFRKQVYVDYRGTFFVVTWLCNECADKIAYEAKLKVAEELKKKLLK